MIIDTASPGTCRACHATVYWRVEKSGKKNPYNMPERCGPCQGEGKIEGADCAKCDGRGRIQISHFATCPAALAFRKKAKK